MNVNIVGFHCLIWTHHRYTYDNLTNKIATIFRCYYTNFISSLFFPPALIAEVILYSEGFESSRILARKMTQMYKLCSEQLSQQDHYDFGMRAVKSVLVMAGSLKRSNPDLGEDVVLIRALRDSNLPKFLSEDTMLFRVSLQMTKSKIFRKIVKKAKKAWFDDRLESLRDGLR